MNIKFSTAEFLELGVVLGSSWENEQIDRILKLIEYELSLSPWTMGCLVPCCVVVSSWCGDDEKKLGSSLVLNFCGIRNFGIQQFKLNSAVEFSSSNRNSAVQTGIQQFKPEIQQFKRNSATAEFGIQKFSSWIQQLLNSKFSSCWIPSNCWIRTWHARKIPMLASKTVIWWRIGRHTDGIQWNLPMLQDRVANSGNRENFI